MERPPLTTAKGNLSSSMSGLSSWRGLVSDMHPSCFKVRFMYDIKDTHLIWGIIIKGSVVFGYNASML